MSERAKSVPAAYWELTKPRLSFLSVLTALAGYFCSAPKEQTDAKVLISLAIGTALAAGGCGAINMWWESDADAKMERTRNRPIPAGILKPGAVLLFGLLLLTLGVILVWTGTNQPLAGALTAATAISYLFLVHARRLTAWRNSSDHRDRRQTWPHRRHGLAAFRSLILLASPPLHVPRSNVP
jgi:protoheme IX farnesyltransferase